ncbi:SPOCS domain-containing protein [Porcipelethomonas sp.]|uniref:DUF3794 domain-containing protein n=1 Tax=Porcipelethomonas sp. TaxID=2981675 RepID=UPI003EFA4634
MDLKINREILSVNEKIYDGVQEQSVELDYILPDYCPDIFKLVKCSIVPTILSSNINGDTVTYELLADIKILYCSEKDSNLQCISQKQTYTKTVQLGDSVNKPEVCLKPKTDHINCRVVNQRRIDMRGAVSVKVKITGEKNQEVICDIFGMNAQMKKIPVEYAAKKIKENKVVTVSEDMEMNMSNPPVINIIRINTVMLRPDKKIIANKLVVKGEAQINVLYTCESGMEKMQFALPYSQIIDMDGLDESYQCQVETNAISCDIIPSANSDGEMKVLKCELKINIQCSAVKSLPVQLVTDAYSTSYPCEYASSKFTIDQIPVQINEVIQAKASVENEGGTVSCVYDAWCSVKNINIRINAEEKCINISGMLCYSIMIKSDNSFPSVVEKEEPFENRLEFQEITANSTVDLHLEAISCTYTLTSSNGISLKTEIRVTGNLYTSSSFEALTDIKFDDTVKIIRDGDYALKLYYGVENEDVWDIAKKYSTSVKAIMEENSLENERLTDNGMLLIPIV